MTQWACPPGNQFGQENGGRVYAGSERLSSVERVNPPPERNQVAHPRAFVGIVFSLRRRPVSLCVLMSPLPGNLKLFECEDTKPAHRNVPSATVLCFRSSKCTLQDEKTRASFRCSFSTGLKKGTLTIVKVAKAIDDISRGRSVGSASAC